MGEKAAKSREEGWKSPIPVPVSHFRIKKPAGDERGNSPLLHPKLPQHIPDSPSHGRWLQTCFSLTPRAFFKILAGLGLGRKISFFTLPRS